jgi:pilus assembly protein FimV
LSELVSDVQPPVVEMAGPLPVPPTATAHGEKGLTGKLPATVTSDVTAPPIASVERPRIVASIKRAQSPGVVRRPVTAAHVSATSKSRLKISMLDLVDIKDPSLKLTQELMMAPTDDLKKRELAAAAWRLLNTTEQDVVMADARQTALSNDLQELKELTAKNFQTQEDLSKRLLKAERERFYNPLVFGLGLLALTALIFAIVMWLKLRQEPARIAPWWGNAGTPDDRGLSATDLAILDSDEPSTLPPGPSDLHVGGVPGNAAAPPKETTSVVDLDEQVIDIDLGLDLHPESAVKGGTVESPGDALPVASVTRKAGPAGVGRRDFSQSLNATLHAINTTEMLDVRQQADFFMTLGQHDEAIRVLEENINLSGSSNPLVFLDLLKVLHTLSKKKEFDRYRSDFNAIFTGMVPEFQSFHRPGRNLEAYPEICAEITKLWATDDVIDYLEDCMIRTDEDHAEDYFELNAYRDLLTLHALASRILGQSASESSLVPFSATKPGRVMESGIEGGGNSESFIANATIPLVDASEVDYSSGIDLDLSEADANLMQYDISEFQLNPKK